MTPAPRPFTALESAMYDAAMADLLRDERRWRVSMRAECDLLAAENARLRAQLYGSPPSKLARIGMAALMLLAWWPPLLVLVIGLVWLIRQIADRI